MDFVFGHSHTFEVIYMIPKHPQSNVIIKISPKLDRRWQKISVRNPDCRLRINRVAGSSMISLWLFEISIYIYMRYCSSYLLSANWATLWFGGAQGRTKGSSGQTIGHQCRPLKSHLCDLCWPVLVSLVCEITYLLLNVYIFAALLENTPRSLSKAPSRIMSSKYRR